MAKRYTPLRLKLVLTFAVSLVLTYALFSFLDYATRGIRSEYYPSYESSKNVIRSLADSVEKQIIQSEDASIVSRTESQAQVYVTEQDGRVFYHSPSVSPSYINIHNTLYETQRSAEFPAPGKFYAEVRPLVVQGKSLYLIVQGSLYAEAGAHYRSDPLASIIIFLLIFLGFFYFFTQSKMRQIQSISQGLQEIADGNLQTRLKLSSNDELGILAHNINVMAQQLKEKIEHEVAVEKSKVELLTNVSHDLRTPLTSIIGYLILLKDKKYQEQEQANHYITSCYNKAEQLKKLIDKLFEYARLTSGEEKLNKQSIDFRQMVEQMIVEFEPIATKSDANIQANLVQQAVPLCVDPEKIVRVLDNLLTNALKYSVKPAAINVSLKVEGSWAILGVSNEGLSISEEDKNKLFERFFHAHDTLSKTITPRGTGLGLSIAKQLIELHGGQIWLDVRDNYYQFFVKLPLGIKN